MHPHPLLRLLALPLLAGLLLLPAGCTHPDRVTQAEPEPPPPAPLPEPAEEAGPDREALVEEALTRSLDAYQKGLEAYRHGDRDSAGEWFDRSLSALLDVDPAIQGDATLESNYRNLMENVHELMARWPEEADAVEPEEVGTPVDELHHVDPEQSPAGDAPRPQVTASGEVIYDIPVVINQRVQTFLDLYTGKWRKQFQRGFERSGRYMEMIHRILAEEGVPLDLAYIPHVESAFKPKALSRVRAYGLWQFMAATGRNYGLQIDYWVDERADAEKATRAAARYLKFLHGMFGDWHLAMASYNAGEYKVQRGLKRSGSDDFWELARTRYLRRETKNFVPAILAAIVIYRDPEKYGFDPASRATPWEYEEIQVNGPVDLMVLAECAGSDLDTLRNLNPELRRNTVFPEATSYRLKVPPGRGQTALARLEEIPPGQRIRQVEHVLQRGETLSLLASKYGTSVRAIQTANNIRDPRRVRAGSRLVVPLTDGVYAAKWLTSTEVNAGGLKVYTVRPGDNPYRIARRHRIPMDRLLRWNGLSKRSVIHPGDRLYLEDPGSARALSRTASKRSSSSTTRASATGAETVYVVRRGDTLGRIASRQGVELNDLLAWNGLQVRSVIRPGDRLVLRSSRGSRPIPAARTAPRAPDGSYVVRSGDNLYDIARTHGVALDDLLAWNDLGKRSLIHPGQRLVLAGDAGAGAADDGWGEPKVYVVRRGDTLYEISRTHAVSVTDLCRWNGISKRKVLHPGDRLTVYTR